MTKSIKAIIYDVDGTLVDTEPLHNEAWDKALNMRGEALTRLSDLFVQQMAGKKPVVIASDMVTELNLNISAEKLLDDKTTIYKELISIRLQPTAGAVASVKHFRKEGYRLAIGTALDRTLLTNILKKIELEDCFDVIVTGDLIKNGKPDPETYLTVLARLGVNPHEAVVFEDAESGIKSAKSAGAWCIALAKNQKVRQNTDLADLVIGSLDEATIELVESLGSSGGDGNAYLV